MPATTEGTKLHNTTMNRRSFIKTAVSTAAAIGLGSTAGCQTAIGGDPTVTVQTTDAFGRVADVDNATLTTIATFDESESTDTNSDFNFNTADSTDSVVKYTVNVKEIRRQNRRLPREDTPEPSLTLTTHIAVENPNGDIIEESEGMVSIAEGTSREIQHILDSPEDEIGEVIITLGTFLPPTAFTGY